MKKSDSELSKCYLAGECLCCPATDCLLRECGINRIREKQHETALAFAKKDEFVSDAEFSDNINKNPDYMQDFLDSVDEEKEPTIADIVRQTKLDTLRHVAHYWAESPNSFDALMRKIMLDQNQSDFARGKGVTRQSISKAIRQERNDKFKKEISRLENLNNCFINFTPLENQIYRICFVDGCTIRSAAQQLKISASKVYRVKQILRVKLSKSETVKTQNSKKREKNK